MNKFIATFIKLKSIYIDKDQVWNGENPEPKKLKIILRKCGYLLGKDLDGWISEEYEKEILENLEDYLVSEFGIDKIWKGVYVSPDDLPEDYKTDQMAIYENPEYINKTRKENPLWETNNYKTLRTLGKSGENELTKYVSDLLSSPVPLRDYNDNRILEWGLDNLTLTYPEKIECKEILCRCLRHEKCIESISSINDILRLVTYISFLDTTLSIKGRIKLKNPDRRLVSRILENYLSGKVNWKDCKKYLHKWIIVSQVLHTKFIEYPRTYNFFQTIKGKDKTWMHNTWDSRLQLAYDLAGKTGSLSEVVDILTERGGEFIRRFDSILRRSWENKDIEVFENLDDKLLSIQNIRPKTLLELYRYYDRRNLEQPRSYVDRSGTRIFYDALPKIDDDLIVFSQNIILGKLKNIWGQNKTLQGQQFYLDISEKDELNLTGQSLSGHYERFEKKGVLRFFSQWIDTEGNQDLDIHGWFVSEDLEKIDRVSWSSEFKDKKGAIKHSGDVRCVKGDCAEYISVDFNRPIPYRYMIIGVQNYNSNKLSDLENYVGVSKVIGKNAQTLFRTKVNLEEKNLIAFIVDFKESTVKYIMEGTNKNICSINPDLFKEYTINYSLRLKKALEICIKSRGGEIVETKTEETITISPEDQENIKKLLLEP